MAANSLLTPMASGSAGYGHPLQDGAAPEVHDLTSFDDKAEYSLAALLVAAAGFVWLLKFAGFRAMIAVGRD